MAKQLFANNASSLLAASIDELDTEIQLDSGYGALFPDPGADEYFVIALENSSGDIEICKVTERVNDLLTVVRGWEGTSAVSWTNGQTRVECRNTAGSMRQMIQRTGDTMEGDLYMDGYTLWDAILQGDTQIIGGGTYGTTFYNSNGDPGNALTIPEDGMSPPLVGDSPVLTVQSFDPQSVFTAGMIMMFYGDVADIPDGWGLCDGNNGRPDLRNKFIVGVGSDYVLGDTGGNALMADAVTASGGLHNHGGETGETELTEVMIPAHTHRLYVWETGNQGDAEGFTTGGGDGPARGVAGDYKTSHTYAYRENNSAGTALIEEAGGTTEEAVHSHTISSSGSSHSHDIESFDNRPPYYALYFIIKLDPAGDYGGVGGGGGPTGSMYDMYNEVGCQTWIGGQATLMDDIVPNVDSVVSINCCASNVFRLVLEEDVTVNAPNNPISGQVINIIVKQANGGGWGVTWPDKFLFPGGTPPALSSAANARDIVTCQYDSADDVWYCNIAYNFTPSALPE